MHGSDKADPYGPLAACLEAERARLESALAANAEARRLLEEIASGGLSRVQNGVPRPTEAPPRENGQFLYSVDELLPILNQPKQVIYRWIRGGHLPAIRMGRSVYVSRLGLEEWLRSGARQ